MVGPAGGDPAQIVPVPDEGPGPGGGGSPQVGIGYPATQFCREFRGVGGDDATHRRLGDLLPDVDLVGDEDRRAGGEGLDDGDAEILLVAGQDEQVGVGKRRDAVAAAEHAGEHDTVAEPRATASASTLARYPSLSGPAIARTASSSRASAKAGMSRSSPFLGWTRPRNRTRGRSPNS